MAQLPTGTVTFLFTDIEGSTKRWEALPAAMAAALARHDALLRAAIERHGGAVFKTVGDAFCAAFADPAAALGAALAAQRALAGEPWGELGPLRVRMALHTGDPEQREADYFGPPVNRVARILATGYGEQVLVSQATADRLRGALPEGAGLLDLGAHRLKDLLQPERVFQLAAPGLDAAFPPLKSLDRRPHNLPAQPTPLVGREAGVAEARTWLERGVRLLTLTGPGGTGKTRLGLQVAADLLDAFPDGAWFVDLAPLFGPDLVVEAIARPLGVREAGHEPLLASVLDYLRDKRLLLVLDNFEHVVAASPVVGQLLAGCPKVAILVTSRAALRVYGEREVSVPPLRLPSLQKLPPIEQLGEVEAVELFVERAAAIQPGFALTEGNARPIAEICVRLEGLPLAIELAAARVRILSPDRLLERLASRLGLLTGGASDRGERQRTLRGAIAWSHDLLAPPEQTLFRRLAVFAGGCPFEAVEAVCDPDGTVGVLDLLDSLVQKSLLRQTDGAGREPRFAMLETIREFGLEQLAASGEEPDLRLRHAVWALALAEEAEPALTGPEQAAWLDRLEAEHDNLRTALDWFGRADDPRQLALSASLWRFWDMRGHLTEGRRWLDLALARRDDTQPTTRAKALEGAGLLAWLLGDSDRAVALHEEALALSRAVRDERGVARASGYLGHLAAARGEFGRAIPLYEEALATFRLFGDRRGSAVALHALSRCALAQERFGQAQALADESLSLWRQLGEPHGTAGSIEHLGRIAWHQEDLVRAVALYDESLGLWQELGDRRGIAVGLVNLGRAIQRQGNRERSATLFDEALVLTRELGDKGGEAFALYSMGHLAQEQGDTDRASRLLAESLALYHQIGEKDGVSWCLEGLAVIYCLRGRALEGVLLLGAAEALREEIGGPLEAPLRSDHERAVAAAQAELDRASFADAWAMGRIMSPDQIVAEVGQIPT